MFVLSMLHDNVDFDFLLPWRRLLDQTAACYNDILIPFLKVIPGKKVVAVNRIPILD